MSSRQPDMQRDHAGLGRKTEKGKKKNHGFLSAGHCRGSRLDGSKIQGSRVRGEQQKRADNQRSARMHGEQVEENVSSPLFRISFQKNQGGGEHSHQFPSGKKREYGGPSHHQHHGEKEQRQQRPIPRGALPRIMVCDIGKRIEDGRYRDSANNEQKETTQAINRKQERKRTQTREITGPGEAAFPA